MTVWVTGLAGESMCGWQESSPGRTKDFPLELVKLVFDMPWRCVVKDGTETGKAISDINHIERGVWPMGMLEAFEKQQN